MPKPTKWKYEDSNQDEINYRLNGKLDYQKKMYDHCILILFGGWCGRHQKILKQFLDLILMS